MSLQPQTFKKLIVEELLADPLDQVFTTDARKTVHSVPVHLYIKGNPAGSLKLSIRDGGVETASKSWSISDLKAEAGISKEHFHGYLNFETEPSINLAPGTYTLRLEGVGYTFSEDDWVGWARLPDKSSNPSEYNLDFRITEIKRRV